MVAAPGGSGLENLVHGGVVVVVELGPVCRPVPQGSGERIRYRVHWGPAQVRP